MTVRTSSSILSAVQQAFAPLPCALAPPAVAGVVKAGHGNLYGTTDGAQLPELLMSKLGVKGKVRCTASAALYPQLIGSRLALPRRKPSHSVIS